MGTTPASAREALDMVRAGLGYLAAVDAAQLGTAAQAECLCELERAEAVLTAARAFILAGFTAGQGYSGDAELQPAGLADSQDPRQQGRRCRAYRVGQAGHHSPAGRRGAGHRGAVGVLRPDHLPVDRQTPRGLPEAADAILLRPPRRGWTCGIWVGWPPRSTSGLARTCLMRIRLGRLRTAPCGWTGRSRARAC